MKIKHVAICGMGALGMLYGKHIAEHNGVDNMHYVMDRERLEDYGKRTFSVNDVPCHFPMRDGMEDVPADLVIVAVKYTGLFDALDVIGKCVGPETIIMSVLNGVTSEEIIGERFGKEHMIYTVAQGSDAVKSGGGLTYTNMGELRIGAKEPCQEANLKAVCDYFDRIGFPYGVEQDIMYRIWSKFMFNVGVNQVCMVYETNYGECADPDSEAHRMMVAAMREAMAVACCEGVPIREENLNEYVRMLDTLAPDAVPSMRQDGLARRRSEVEIFAGTVRTLAKKHHILVPVNEFLYKRVMEIESSY